MWDYYGECQFCIVYQCLARFEYSYCKPVTLVDQLYTFFGLYLFIQP